MSLETRTKNYGAQFGDWQIGERLGGGSGGKSVVYLLEKNSGVQEVCAMKVVSLLEETGSFDSLPDFRKCEFQMAAEMAKTDALREVALMSQLRGKTNIVDYLDHQIVSWHDEQGFGVDLLIRMEKLNDLRQMILANHRFSERDIQQLGMDICRALILTHGKRIIHRDIKPENIFINTDGDYKLGDFGISRIMSSSPASRASTGIGTAAYSAPEQTRGSYDERVDIYSLGLVMYELLNGNRLPFATSSYIHESQIQLRLSGMSFPYPRMQRSLNAYSTESVPNSELACIIMKACAYRPENRYHSAGEMLADLQKIGNKPVSTPPVIPSSAGSRPSAPNPVVPASAHSNPAIGKIRFSLIPLLVLGAILAGLLLGNLFRHHHDWENATCATPRTCTTCGAISGEALGHQWIGATCTEAEFCDICGETRGSPLGHSWSSGACTTAAACTVCGESTGEISGHHWISATCTKAEFCDICGETRGSPLGHNWNEATCESPMTCTRCPEQTGHPLGHDWLPATFHQPSTCSRCKTAVGTPIPVSSISLESEIENIRTIYYDIMDRREQGLLREVWIQPNAIVAYYNSAGLLECVEISSAVDGLDGYGSKYRRMYVYHNNELIFALLTGQDSHRLYFYHEMQIRWLYRPNAAVFSEEYFYDLTFSSDYIKWETLALEEARSFLN